MTKFAWWMVRLLGLQFVLGMLANMFQEIPADSPYSVFRQAGPILFHTVLAWILTILAVVYAVKTWKLMTDERRLAIKGLIGILVAHGAGVLFTVYGQNEWWSFVMAIGFLVAFASYLIAAVRNPNAKH